MYMLKYVLKRFGLMLMSFAVIMTMCFVLIKMLPIVIDVQFGKDSDILKEQIERRGYNDPIIEQYFRYIYRIVFEGDVITFIIGHPD